MIMTDCANARMTFISVYRAMKSVFSSDLTEFSLVTSHHTLN